MSQAVLAEKASISTGFLGEIETEKSFPSIQKIQQIADALEVPPWILFKPEEDNETGLLKSIENEIINSVKEVIKKASAPIN